MRDLTNKCLREILEKWNHGKELEGLNKRIHGIDRGRGLGTLIPFRWFFLFLTTVLSNERAILIELAIHSLSIVH